MRSTTFLPVGGLSLEAATLGLGAALAVTMFVSLVARVWLVRGSETPDELTLYQVAMLAGGKGRASDVALAFLTWSGMVEVRESTDRLVRVAGVNTVPDLHAIELAVLGAIDTAGVRPEAAMGAGRMAAHDHVDGLAGLVVDARSGALVDLGVAAGSAAVVGAGGYWLSARGDSEGFLLLLMVAAVVYAAWWFVSGRPRRTTEGQELLEVMRRGFDDDLHIAAIGVTSLPVERAMHIIALYGRDALTGGLSGLRKVMTGNPAPVPVVRSSLSL